MPTGASARLGLDAPATGAEQVQQGDDLFRAWRLALEARAAMYQVGFADAMPSPAAANVGMMYVTRDWGVTYISTGTAWKVLGGFTGALHWSARTLVPDGFLKCAGQQITTIYPDLRAALIADGNPWGAVGGNPLAPPTGSRSLMAAGAANAGAGLSARTVGQTLGEESHLITETESWRHFHELRQQTGIGGGIAVDAPGQAGRVSQGGADPITAGPGSTEFAGGNPQTRMNVVGPVVVANLLIQT